MIPKAAATAYLGVLSAWKDYLAHDLRVVSIGAEDYYAQEREHWLLASNILVVAKNTIIAYEHNRVTNKLAKEAGIKIVNYTQALFGIIQGSTYLDLRERSLPAVRDLTHPGIDLPGSDCRFAARSAAANGVA